MVVDIAFEPSSSELYCSSERGANSGAVRLTFESSDL